MCRRGEGGNFIIVNSTVSVEERRDEILATMNGSRGQAFGSLMV